MEIVTKAEGSKVIVVSDYAGHSQGPIKCKDELTAALLSGYINKYQKIATPYMSGQEGYPVDNRNNSPRIMLRYTDSVVQDVGRAVNYDDAERFYHGRSKDVPFPQDEKLVNEVMLAFNAEKEAKAQEIPKTGFISKPVYRVEPENGKSYWFAERYLDGKKARGDMRCANKAVAESLCASDMRLGYARSCMDEGHFYEAGDRYIRMERGLVTECYDAGDSRLNKDYFDKRKAEYGPVKHKGGIADPDPEPTVEAKPEAKEATPVKDANVLTTAERVAYLQNLQDTTLKAVQKEVADGQRAFFNTGVIPRPSDMMMAGYEKGCNRNICTHIESWRKQELGLSKKEATVAAEVDRVTKALQQLSQDIATKKSLDEKDARVGEVTATVKQVNTSNETNKENQAMANNEKPVADTKPAARVPSQIELEARAAALRTGMKQLTKLIHEPLAAALAAQLCPPGGDASAMKAQVSLFLKGELGSALVSAMLSIAINSIPANTIPGFTAERQSLVAQELRVKAMTEVGDTLVDLVAAPLRAALAGLMTGPGAEALTGVRAEDAGLDGASTAQEEAPAAAQADNVKRVNFG